jgi:hypothetical protein
MRNEEALPRREREFSEKRAWYWRALPKTKQARP